MKKIIVILSFCTIFISSIFCMESPNRKKHLSIDLKIRKIKLELAAVHKKKYLPINLQIKKVYVELAAERLKNLEFYRKAK